METREIVLIPIEDLSGPETWWGKVIVAYGDTLEEWVVDSEEGVILPPPTPQKASGQGRASSSSQG